MTDIRNQDEPGCQPKIILISNPISNCNIFFDMFIKETKHAMHVLSIMGKHSEKSKENCGDKIQINLKKEK